MNIYHTYYIISIHFFAVVVLVHWFSFDIQRLSLSLVVFFFFGRVYLCVCVCVCRSLHLATCTGLHQKQRGMHSGKKYFGKSSHNNNKKRQRQRAVDFESRELRKTHDWYDLLRFMHSLQYIDVNLYRYRCVGFVFMCVCVCVRMDGWAEAINIFFIGTK